MLDTPHSKRALQRAIEKSKDALLKLELQELERIRREKPYTQPQSVWASRIHRQKQSAQLAILSNNGVSGLNLVEEEEEEEEEEEDNDETRELIETEDLEVEDENMHIVCNGQQQSEVDQSIGTGMGQRLEFFAQQMSVRHKDTTTRQYSQHVATWKVSVFSIIFITLLSTLYTTY